MERIDYKDPDFAMTVAELIEKHEQFQANDGKLSVCYMTSSVMKATQLFFIQSSKNWFPSVISLDKTFRQQ